MGGGGSIAGMIISLRNNKQLLRKKHLFKKERTFLGTKAEYYKAAQGKIEVKRITSIELKKIRERVIENRKKENRKTTLIVFCFLIPLLSLGFYFISGYNEEQNIYNDEVEKIEFIEKNKKYQFYISDGDRWIGKQHLNNAVFQYKKALEIFPNEFDANYRLAIAYSYKCINKKQDCDLGKLLTGKIKKEFPKKKEILKLETIFE